MNDINKRRKYTSKSKNFYHRDNEYRINNSQRLGIHPEILKPIVEQLYICKLRWNRVLMIRADLRQKHYTGDSKMVSRFRKNLGRRLERAYNLPDFGFAWVREQERAKKQHYHFALFLDGDVVNHSAKVNTVIQSTWEAVSPGNSVYHPQKCFINIRDEETMQDAVYRLSYLAKTRGKGRRPPQAKDFSTSRLRAPHTPATASAGADRSNYS